MWSSKFDGDLNKWRASGSTTKRLCHTAGGAAEIKFTYLRCVSRRSLVTSLSRTKMRHFAVVALLCIAQVNKKSENGFYMYFIQIVNTVA